MSDNESIAEGSAHPLVSVLLPVFNGEGYLKEALESLSAQSYRNLEIVVVDDGSTDGTAEILRAAAENDSRINIICTSNHGLTSALNRAIDEANGPLVARMDADDVAETMRIEMQVAHMLEHKDCIAVGCSITHINADGANIDPQPRVRPTIDVPDRCCNFRRFPPAPPALVHPSAMMRLSALKRVGGYRPYFLFGAEDRDLWWRLADLGKFHCLRGRLLRYRVHLGNRSKVLQDGAIADTLICDLSAICRHYALDDDNILKVYAATHDLSAAVGEYEGLIGPRYPVWALHAYRILRRRAWSLAGATTQFAFRRRSLLRAIARPWSRPSWYVIGALFS